MGDVAGIRTASVTRWFEAHVPQAKPPFAVELIAGGHSNLTYKLTDQAGVGFVLRRPPLGSVLESAHDMGREHKIVSALGPTDVPVAPVFGLCADPAVNDAPFYVMGFVEGEVLHDPERASRVPEPERRAIGLDVIAVLARLHALDPDAVGLGDLGRKADYVPRQLRRWSRQWQASKVREVPDMERVHRLLEERVPEQVGATIVHGDYRLGNFLVRDGRIAAVLDWELCTLGDPLADLGYLLNNWDPPGPWDASSGVKPTLAGGFPDREELIRRYRRATGRDLSQIGYYRAFSYWRSGAINEGVYSRYLAGAYGSTDGLDLSRFELSTPFLARTALELLESAP